MVRPLDRPTARFCQWAVDDGNIDRNYLFLTGPPDKDLYPTSSPPQPRRFPPADENVSSPTTDMRRHRDLNKVIIRRCCYVDRWYQRNDHVIVMTSDRQEYDGLYDVIISQYMLIII